jgi:hypothetical protein
MATVPAAAALAAEKSPEKSAEKKLMEVSERILTEEIAHNDHKRGQDQRFHSFELDF